MILPRTLLTYYDGVYALERPLAPSSDYCHRRSLRVFTDWLGDDPFLSHLTDILISAFVRDMASRYAPATVSRMRANILATWRHAADLGLVQGPGRVRAVKIPPPMPDAWTVHEVRKLLLTTGRLNRHSRYFDRFLRVGWDVGLRKADIESLSLAAINDENVALVRQRKTGQPLAIALRESTVAVLRMHGHPFPLRRPFCASQSYYWWRRLCDLADVSRGGPQKLRRSAATNVELHHPGASTSFLGHTSPDLARRHYLDQRILRQHPPRPEEL